MLVCEWLPFRGHAIVGIIQSHQPDQPALVAAAHNHRRPRLPAFDNRRARVDGESALTLVARMATRTFVREDWFNIRKKIDRKRRGRRDVRCPPRQTKSPCYNPTEQAGGGL